MHLHQLAVGLELLNILQKIAKARLFQPAAHAHLDAQRPAAARQRQRPAVIHGGADQACHAAQRGHRRVVGMQRQPHAGLLADGQDAFQKPGKIVPDFIGIVHPVIADGAAFDFIQIRKKGGAAAGIAAGAAPGAENAVGLPCHRHQRRAHFPRQPHKIGKLADGLFPFRAAQNDVGVLLQRRAGKVGNFQPEPGQTVCLLPQLGQRGVFRHDVQIQIFHAHFPDKGQLLLGVAKTGGQFHFDGHWGPPFR